VRFLRGRFSCWAGRVWLAVYARGRDQLTTNGKGRSSNRTRGSGCSLCARREGRKSSVDASNAVIFDGKSGEFATNPGDE
jgi:hypothetical protein